MMDTTNSTNKRKEGVTSEEVPPTKKLSREARKRRNKRLKWEREHGHEQIEPPHVPDDIPTNSSTDSNIVFDPTRHKIQPETRESTDEEARQYILSQWVSEDFLASDLRPSSHRQSTIYTDPRFTFQEKFLGKRRQRSIVRELLKRGLLPPSSVKSGTFTLDFNALSNNHLDIISDFIQENLYKDGDNDDKKSLAPRSTQPIPTSSEVPAKFMDLLETEIFCTSSINPSTLRSLWKKFARWSCFATGPNYAQQFRNHCCRLWSQVNHIYRYVDAKNKPLEGHNIHKTLLRHPSDKLYIAEETTKIVASDTSLNGFQHVFNPQCFTNTLEETVVDFFDIDKILASGAEAVVDKYCKHMFDDPTHQSKQFKSDLIEHFGCFTDSNNTPYTTANTASSHHKAHQKCVQDLIKGLQPLSGSVNNYLESTYPDLYAKMKRLDLGPNVPKSFGAFPTVSVNFNIICQFHRDLKDHRNSLCVVCPLGNFKGGELTFPELKLIVHVKQGQAVAFRSNLLVHGNLPVIAGVRHSVVFYIHNTVIKQKRKFGSLFADYELDWDNNSNEDEALSKYLPPTLGSGDNVVKPKNHRRTHIDVKGAKKGLPARYKNNNPISYREDN